MQELQQIETQAEELKEQARYLDALQLYEQAISLRKRIFGPDSAEHKAGIVNLCEICNTLGNVFLQQSSWELAQDLLTRALILSDVDDTCLAQTLNNLGLLYRRLGRVNSSLKYFRKALEFNPNYAQTHLNLSSTLSSLDRHARALSHARFATVLLQDILIDLLQNDDESYQEKAGSLAIAYFNTAVELEFLERVNHKQNDEAVKMYLKSYQFAKSNLDEQNSVRRNIEEQTNGIVKRIMQNFSRAQDDSRYNASSQQKSGAKSRTPNRIRDYRPGPVMEESIADSEAGQDS